MSNRFAKRGLSPHNLGYVEQGNGSPVVLLHGVGLCADVWLPQQRSLSQHHRAISVDLPGHGSSAMLKLTEPSLDDYAEAVAHTLIDLCDEPVTLVGHSLGALLAIRIATNGLLAVNRAVFLSCIHQRSAQARDAAQHRARSLRDDAACDPASLTLERWFGRSPCDPDRASADECRRWLTHAYRGGYADAYRVFADQWGPSEDELARLAPPALFMTGSSDHNSTRAMSEALAKQVKHGYVHIVEGGAHMIGMTHADEVNSVLSEFCAQC